MESEDRIPESGIPEVLHSAFSGKPFGKCVDCGGELLDALVPYAIEKAYRQGEVVFEYALCAVCTEALVRQFSEESMRNISSYLEELELESSPDLGHCDRCGRAAQEFADEHTVTGLLVGNQMLVGPTIMCNQCLEGVESVLSQKTRDVHGEFIKDNFPGVPAHLDVPLSILGH